MRRSMFNLAASREVGVGVVESSSDTGSRPLTCRTGREAMLRRTGFLDRADWRKPSSKAAAKLGRIFWSKRPAL